jgi:hypothetical protein
MIRRVGSSVPSGRSIMQKHHCGGHGIALGALVCTSAFLLLNPSSAYLGSSFKPSPVVGSHQGDGWPHRTYALRHLPQLAGTKTSSDMNIGLYATKPFLITSTLFMCASIIQALCRSSPNHRQKLRVASKARCSVVATHATQRASPAAMVGICEEVVGEHVKQHNCNGTRLECGLLRKTALAAYACSEENVALAWHATIKADASATSKHALGNDNGFNIPSPNEAAEITSKSFQRSSFQHRSRCRYQSRASAAHHERRRVGSRLQTRPSYEPLVSSYDPSRIPAKLQGSLQIRGFPSMGRSREPKTASACTGPTTTTGNYHTSINVFDEVAQSEKQVT